MFLISSSPVEKKRQLTKKDQGTFTKMSVQSHPHHPDVHKSHSIPVPDDTPFLSDWGFTLKDLYNLCVHFYKGNISYKVNWDLIWNRLIIIYNR